MTHADPGPLRRLALFAFVLVATAAATQLLSRALGADGLSVPEIGILPLFALSGIEGRLFTPLGVAYIVSILASLLVSLTVTPVLSYYLLARSKATHREGDGPLVRVLKWAAGYLIRFSMRHALLILLVTWLVVAYAGWRLFGMKGDFLPPFNEGTAQVNLTLPAGSWAVVGRT